MNEPSQNNKSSLEELPMNEPGQKPKSNLEELLDAAEEGDETKLKECLSRLNPPETTIDDESEEGWTALELAAEKGHLGCLTLLLVYGASVSYESKEGWGTALSRAAHGGHRACLALLLRCNAAVDYESKDGWTALGRAVVAGQVGCAELLLDRGAAVDYESKKESWTALGRAAWEGRTECVPLLLKRGAMVDHDSRDGWTALALAASEGHKEFIIFLLRHGAAVDYESRSGRTALKMATKHLDCLMLLLENNANIDYEPITGRTTALMMAAIKGQEQTLAFLLQHGATVDYESANGWTALMRAAHAGKTASLVCLLKNGADVNYMSHQGWTALEQATDQGQEACVVMLLQHGADVDYMTPDHGTTLWDMKQKVVDLFVDGILDEEEAFKQRCAEAVTLKAKYRNHTLLEAYLDKKKYQCVRYLLEQESWFSKKFQTVDEKYFLLKLLGELYLFDPSSDWVEKTLIKSLPDKKEQQEAIQSLITMAMGDDRLFGAYRFGAAKLILNQYWDSADALFFAKALLDKVPKGVYYQAAQDELVGLNALCHVEQEARWGLDGPELLEQAKVSALNAAIDPSTRRRAYHLTMDTLLDDPIFKKARFNKEDFGSNNQTVLFLADKITTVLEEFEALGEPKEKDLSGDRRVCGEASKKRRHSPV